MQPHHRAMIQWMELVAKLDEERREAVRRITGIDRFEVKVEPRKAGKTAASIMREAFKRIDEETGVWIDEIVKPPPKAGPRWWGMDLGSKDAFAIGTWHVKDGKMVVEDVVTVDLPAPATPEPPAKVLHHNRGFFPNKIGRIDVLPRYPGTWG